jgi:hypothetical protein
MLALEYAPLFAPPGFALLPLAFVRSLAPGAKARYAKRPSDLRASAPPLPRAISVAKPRVQVTVDHGHNRALLASVFFARLSLHLAVPALLPLASPSITQLQ